METGVEKQENGIIPSFPRMNKQRRKGEAWGWDGYRGVQVGRFLVVFGSVTYLWPPGLSVGS